MGKFNLEWLLVIVVICSLAAIALVNQVIHEACVSQGYDGYYSYGEGDLRCAKDGIETISVQKALHEWNRFNDTK